MDVAQKLLEKQIARQAPIHVATEKGGSEIQRFYDNANVFITGGTGFLGKQLIEKLLRSCNINKIYLLMRPKKGSPVNERLVNCLKDPVFELLREKKPDFAKHVIPVEGDIAELKLGLSDQDWSILSQEVTVVFHVAATTRFDEPLRVATIYNVRGTRELILLAKDCKNLKSFVHVSTAFCHATKSRAGGDVAETFYPCPVPPATMIDLVENVDDERLNKITESLIEDWPNTYTFSKAIAEEAVRTLADGLPACIVRPPVVVAALIEPAPGWMDLSAVYGPTGVIVGIGTGVTHVSLNGDKHLAYMPVDFVNNACIAAGWDAAVRHTGGDREVKIHNVSTYRNQVTWGLGRQIMKSEETKCVYTPKAVWYCYMVETTNRAWHWILTWLLHYIPAYIVEAIVYVFGIKKPEGMPSLLKIYEKIYKMSIIYSYFLTNEWHFTDDNALNLINKMSEQDRIIYNFDAATIDWKNLMWTWCLGCRKYIVKDGLKDTEYAQKKQFWLRIAHYIFMAVYLYAFIYIAYLFISIFMSFTKF